MAGRGSSPGSLAIAVPQDGVSAARRVFGLMRRSVGTTRVGGGLTGAEAAGSTCPSLRTRPEWRQRIRDGWCAGLARRHVPSCVRAGSAGKLQPPPAACQPAQGRGDPGRQVGRAASRACGVGGGADSPNRRARTARGARPRRPRGRKGRRAARASSCGRGPGGVCGGRRRRAPACSGCVCGGGRRTTMACRAGSGSVGGEQDWRAWGDVEDQASES